MKNSITIKIDFLYNQAQIRENICWGVNIDIHYSQAKHIHNGVDEFRKLDGLGNVNDAMKAVFLHINSFLIESKYISASWNIWRVWSLLGKKSFYNTKDKIFVRWRYCYSASFSLKLKLEANFQRRQSVKHLNWLYDESLYFM